MMFRPPQALSQKYIILVGVCTLLSFLITPALASDRFVSNGDGTVTDAQTNLMWAATDNGTPINWPDALSYCQHFRGGGHSDWRMPTLAELKSLYAPRDKNKKGYHISQLIDTTAASCWAADTRGIKAGRFNFTYGKVYWLRKFYSGPTRVLPVR